MEHSHIILFVLKGLLKTQVLLIIVRLANPQLLERVRYFRVADLTELNDRCCISTSIDANFTITSSLDNIPTKPCPERFIWRSPYKKIQ